MDRIAITRARAMASGAAAGRYSRSFRVLSPCHLNAVKMEQSRTRRQLLTALFEAIAINEVRKLKQRQQNSSLSCNSLWPRTPPSSV